MTDSLDVLLKLAQIHALECFLDESAAASSWKLFDAMFFSHLTARACLTLWRQGRSSEEVTEEDLTLYCTGVEDPETLHFIRCVYRASMEFLRCEGGDPGRWGPTDEELAREEEESLRDAWLAGQMGSESFSEL